MAALVTGLGLPRLEAKPVSFDAAAYDAIHPKLFAAVEDRTSGEGCGGWYEAYAKAHAAVRSGQDPHPRYAVMVSFASGLADRLTCSLTVLLYAVLSNRAYEYVWYGNHVLWDSLQSPYIDWRAPPRNLTLGKIARGGSGGEGDPVLPVVTENHFWAKPDRSELLMPFYSQSGRVHERLKTMFANSDISAGGALHDVVLWELNHGMVGAMMENPWISGRLKSMGLSLDTVAYCLFNLAYTPSPAALAPLKGSALLDRLMDPLSFVIAIQVRIGDQVFWGQDNATQALETGAPYFDCAQQLTTELERAPEFGGFGGPGEGSGDHVQSALRSIAAFQQADTRESEQPVRKVYWMLISDSALLRKAAKTAYGGSGRLLVAEDLPIDHVQDYARNGQGGLHAAAAELWLFGQADMHIVTGHSNYGRLGAVAGKRSPQIYGVHNHGHRTCKLGRPDPMDDIFTWAIWMRRSRARSSRRSG